MSDILGCLVRSVYGCVCILKHPSVRLVDLSGPRTTIVRRRGCPSRHGLRVVGLSLRLVGALTGQHRLGTFVVLLAWIALCPFHICRVYAIASEPCGRGPRPLRCHGIVARRSMPGLAGMERLNRPWQHSRSRAAREVRRDGSAYPGKGSALSAGHEGPGPKLGGCRWIARAALAARVGRRVLAGGRTGIGRGPSWRRTVNSELVLFVSPERLLNAEFLSLFVDGLSISVLVIDEAHCISEWSHNFRPSYLRLKSSILRRKLSVQCILAMTATATVQTFHDITCALEIQPSNRIKICQVRENLQLFVTLSENRQV
ncbi:hypothetical protein ZIOFF_042317 [Zingiber officinale]|uniref:Helicase ATP-binding domain-containing protein n=1 Tax=Zingiber officinale TaxID=94328 RepID=A0A8J5KXS3_ZINOF|nr:hypothetical protein ZIOFF_042317 [Zingiber officinale]